MINIHVAALKYHLDPDEKMSYKQFTTHLTDLYKTKSNKLGDPTFTEFLRDMVERINK